MFLLVSVFLFSRLMFGSTKTLRACASLGRVIPPTYYLHTYFCMVSHKQTYTYMIYILEKWFPLQGERAFLELSKTKQRGGGTEQQQQTYQLTQGYNILHRLQVHHLTLIFIIHNKYISTLYLYTYIIVIVNFINDNAFY